jgi:hypothetical protein
VFWENEKGPRTRLGSPGGRNRQPSSSPFSESS